MTFTLFELSEDDPSLATAALTMAGCAVTIKTHIQIYLPPKQL